MVRVKGGCGRVGAGGRQGLTHVHFSAQLKRILSHRGCIEELFTGCLGGDRGY